jgi:hypothetical protein
MRFLCLVYFKPETLAALSPSEKATLDRDSMAYNDELRHRNHYILPKRSSPCATRVPFESAEAKRRLPTDPSPKRRRLWAASS